ncbi:amidase [Rhodococcus phenolicus]|uniref:amidase n=1 Tax=Rhodococcus phenolicus TaxID=263849 RepID=UPI00082F79BE|nr:amidase [Rhodococcus phenolicus]
MTATINRRRFLGGAVAGVAVLGVSRVPAAATTPARRLPDPGSVSETDPALMSATSAAALLQAGHLHPRELLDACITRSRAFDGEIGAWIRMYPEIAYAAADAAAERLGRARRDGVPESPLCGVPIALKDIFAVAGLPLTASSRVLEGNVAAGDSGVWRRLRDAGAVLLGHVHTDEFAIGVATSQVGNPWNTDFSPGGSSGGSAAALAARFVPLSVGSDTGGSVRLPASACGVSSVKPSFGRVSVAGMIPLTPTRDHVGVLGRSVGDAVLLLDALVGEDPSDPATLLGPPLGGEGFASAARGGAAPLGGSRLGVPDAAVAKLPAPLRSLFDGLLDAARALGAEIVPVVAPAEPASLATGDMAEMGTYHRQFSDRVHLYRPERLPALASAAAGLALPAAEYFGLERDRLRFQYDYNRMFVDNDLDAVVYPGTFVDGARRNEFLEYTVSAGVQGDVRWANYAGAPVVSIPVGRSSATGIPFGVQIGGRAWQDREVVAVALELQEALPVWRDVPPIAPAPRAIPEVPLAAAGPGPDPTNTLDARATILPAITTATGPG